MHGAQLLASAQGLALGTRTQGVSWRVSSPHGSVVQVGHSLGGGVAAQVGRLYPGVHVCGERTFSSVADVSPFFVLPRDTVTRALDENDAAASLPLTSRPRLVRMATQALVVAVRLVVQLALRWNLDAAGVWHTIRGRKWVVHTPADGVIPVPAQLQSGLDRRRTTGRAGLAPWWWCAVARRRPAAARAAAGAEADDAMPPMQVRARVRLAVRVWFNLSRAVGVRAAATTHGWRRP